MGRISTLSDQASGDSLRSYVYTYTTAGRLREISRGGLIIGRWSYDANGNRDAAAGPAGGAVDSAICDGQDRLLSYGHLATGYKRYSYTKNGELTQVASPGGTTGYTYDELGNLTNVTLPGGTQIRYLIDGQNRRVGKKRNGTLERVWLYQNGLNVVAELDGSGNLVSRFVYGSRSNVPDYMVQGSTTYRIISDQLGSVRRVVNASTGALAQRLEYDAWGQVLMDTAPGFQPFGFAGGLYDPDTKVVRFGARDYDASVGRWTCKDPIHFVGRDANLFAYRRADPLNGIDLSGLDYLSFDGDTLSWHQDDGTPTDTYPAVSGPYGQDRLPAGEYRGKNLRKRSSPKGMLCDGKGWSVDLAPQFRTGRTDLRIHPDGNVPGTEGCIGVDCRRAGELYRRLKQYMKDNNGSIPVTVKYPESRK